MPELIVPRAGARRWPLALGLVLDSPAELGELRAQSGSGGSPGEEMRSPGWDPVTSRYLAVALAAYRGGYFLLHTVRAQLEARHDGPVIGQRDCARLRTLAMSTDADGLFVIGLGPGELGSLEPMADELRLTLHAVGAITDGATRHGTGAAGRGTGSDCQEDGPG